MLTNSTANETRGCGRWGAARYGAVLAAEYGQTEETAVAMATRAPGARDPYATCQISSWSDNRQRSYGDFLQTTQLAAVTLTSDRGDWKCETGKWRTKNAGSESARLENGAQKCYWLLCVVLHCPKKVTHWTPYFFRTQCISAMQAMSRIPTTLVLSVSRPFGQLMTPTESCQQ